MARLAASARQAIAGGDASASRTDFALPAGDSRTWVYTEAPGTHVGGWALDSVARADAISASADLVRCAGFSDTGILDAFSHDALHALVARKFGSARRGAAAFAACLSDGAGCFVVHGAVAVVVDAVAQFVVLAGFDDGFAKQLALTVAFGDAELASPLLGAFGTRLSCPDACNAREAEQKVFVIEVVPVYAGAACSVEKIQIFKTQIERVGEFVGFVDERGIPRTRRRALGAVRVETVLGVVVLRRVAGARPVGIGNQHKTDQTIFVGRVAANRGCRQIEFVGRRQRRRKGKQNLNVAVRFRDVQICAQIDGDVLGRVVAGAGVVHVVPTDGEVCASPFRNVPARKITQRRELLRLDLRVADCVDSLIDVLVLRAAVQIGLQRGSLGNEISTREFHVGVGRIKRRAQQGGTKQCLHKVSSHVGSP